MLPEPNNSNPDHHAEAQAAQAQLKQLKQLKPGLQKAGTHTF
jgi:hypothetical protein